MESPTAVSPAGTAHGHVPQMGPQKALALEPSPLLREGSKASGGQASPRSPPKSPRGVHFPKDSQGGLGPMASDPNPKQDPKTGTNTPAPLSGTQVMSPTHTNTPTASVTGSVGGDWV